MQGNPEGAEANFRSAMERGGEDYTCHYEGLGLIYLRQERIPEARELLRRSIRNVPYDDEAKALLADISAPSGPSGKALWSAAKDALQALRGNPDKYFAILFRGFFAKFAARLVL